MATSGDLITTNSGGYRNVKFSWTLDSQSVANNSSIIKWTLTGNSDGTDGWYYAGPFNVTIKDAANNTNKIVNNLYPSGSRIQLRSGTTVASGQCTIYHNSSGVGTFSVTISASVYLATENCTASGSFTPTAIARGSVWNLSTTSFTAGTAASLAYTSHTTASHRIYYVVNGTEYKQADVASAAAGSKTYANWDFSSIANKLTSSTGNFSITLRLKTYTDNNYSTQIGSTSEATISLKIPTYSLTIGKATIIDSNTSITNVTGSTSTFVQGLSTIKVTFPSITTKWGASITQYAVTLDNIQYTSTTPAVTCASPKKSGTLTLKVTDSRGQIGTKTQNITVTAYSSPTLSASVTRNTTTPTTITVKINSCSATSVKVSSTEKNTMQVIAYYKTSSATSWSSKTIQAASTTLSLTNSSTNITGLSASTKYNFRVTVTDKFGKTSEKTFTVAAQSSFIDIQVGKIGIGTYAGSYALNVNGNTYLDGYLNTVSNITAGTTSDTGAIGVGATNVTGNAQIHVAASGNRGVYLGANQDGSIAAHWLIYENQSGSVYVDGKTPVYTTTDQTIYGAKTFISWPQVRSAISNSTGIHFQFTNSASANTSYGYIFLAYADYGGRMWFRQFSGTQSGRTSYYDQFAFPVTAIGKTGNNSYEILTSKSAVTVGQGGTGATSAANARVNLGVNQPASLSSVSIAGNATGTLSVTTANYKFYLFKFTCNSRITTIFTTYSQLSTSAQTYWIYDGSSSGAQVIITRTASSITVKRDGSTACSVVLTYWN